MTAKTLKTVPKRAADSPMLTHHELALLNQLRSLSAIEQRCVFGLARDLAPKRPSLRLIAGGAR